MGVLLVRLPFDIKHFPPLPIPRAISFSFQAATPKTVDETPQERPSRSLEDVDSFWIAEEKYLLSFKLYLPDRTRTIHVEYKHPCGNITSHLEFLSPRRCLGLRRGKLYKAAKVLDCWIRSIPTFNFSCLFAVALAELPANRILLRAACFSFMKAC